LSAVILSDRPPRRTESKGLRFLAQLFADYFPDSRTIGAGSVFDASNPAQRKTEEGYPRHGVYATFAPSASTTKLRTSTVSQEKNVSQNCTFSQLAAAISSEILVIRETATALQFRHCETVKL
jgi:hypothetical protein